MGDNVRATVIPYRLLYHGLVPQIRGECYRQRDERQAGLLTSQRLPGTGAEVIKDNRNWRRGWTNHRSAIKIQTRVGVHTERYKLTYNRTRPYSPWVVASQSLRPSCLMT